MKTTKIITLATVLLLSACQQAETDEPRPAPTEGVPLRLASGINTVQTRAFNSSWERNDAIGVFTVAAGGTASDVTYSGTQPDENIKYTISAEAFTGTASSVETDNSGTPAFKSFLPGSSQIYLPANGSAVDVYAYYPWTLNVKVSAPLEINIPTTQRAYDDPEDEEKKENQKAVDVLKAKATVSTDKKPDPATDYYPINIDHTTAQLQFSHIMSKVLVRVVVGEGYGEDDLNGSNISSVVLSGQPTVATFAPVTQALSITAGSNHIQMAELKSDSGDSDYVSKATVSLKDGADPTEESVIHNYRAIILPNTDATGTNPVTSGSERQIRFNVGSVTYTYNITQAFQPGYQTEYTIILAANEVTVQAAITPWTANVITTPKPLTPDP